MEAQRLQVGGLIERMHQGRSKAKAQLLAMHRELLAARQENQELRRRLGGPGAAAVAAFGPAAVETAAETVAEDELRQEVALLQSRLLQFQGFLEEAHTNIGELQVGGRPDRPSSPFPTSGLCHTLSSLQSACVTTRGDNIPNHYPMHCHAAHALPMHCPCIVHALPC